MKPPHGSAQIRRFRAGIDSEASTRAGADITLQGHLDAEAISRSSGDSALDTRVGELETGRLKKDAEIPTAGETSSAAVDADSVYTVTNTSPNIIPTDLLSYPILADIPISAEGFRAQSVPSSAVTDGIRTGVHGVVSINDEEDLSQTSVINAGVRGTASGNAAGQQGWVYNVGLFGAARGTQTEQGTVTNIGTYAFADGTSETAVGLMAEAAGGAVRSTGIGAYVAGAGGSSENVGGRFDVQSNGGPLPATHYGIRASASGAEQNYGGWFDVHSNGGPIPATHYGIFASASGAETNWAGYFQGDVKVTDDLEVDGELDVSEDISAANYPKMVAAEASNEISLGTSYSDVVSVSITTASAGSILVTFSGYLQTDTAGGYVQAGVGTNDGAVTRYVRAQSTETSEYHPFSVQYLYTNPEGGTFTYYGNAMSSIAGGDVYQPYMTAVYTD